MKVIIIQLDFVQIITIILPFRLHTDHYYLHWLHTHLLLNKGYIPYNSVQYIKYMEQSYHGTIQIPV
jgi:hypothetical protein